MVYTTPGDSVYIGIQQIEGNEIYHFTGRNSAHYNFFALLNIHFKMKDTPHYSNGINLNEYKRKKYCHGETRSCLF